MTSTSEKAQSPQKYKILSKRCTFGLLGQVVDLSLTPGEELSMTEAGMLQKVRPIEAAKVRPVVAADKRGK